MGIALEDADSGSWAILLVRPRKEEVIDGIIPRALRARQERKSSLANFHELIRGKDIDLIRAQGNVLGHLRDAHPGRSGENLGEQALGSPQDMREQYDLTSQ